MRIAQWLGAYVIVEAYAISGSNFHMAFFSPSSTFLSYFVHTEFQVVMYSTLHHSFVLYLA